MRLLLVLLFVSACGRPVAETRAVTDGRLTLKLQRTQEGSNDYRLVVCRHGSCQNVLTTHAGQQALFRDATHIIADGETRQLATAKIAIEKSGGSILTDMVSMTTAIGIGVGIGSLIFLSHKIIRNKRDLAEFTSKHYVRLIANKSKTGVYKRVEKDDKKWTIHKMSRGIVTLVDGAGQKKKVKVRGWPNKSELLGFLVFPVGGGTLGGRLYWRHNDRAAMLADRMTADNWQAIFSKDPTVNVKIKNVKYIVYSLAQTFDLKVNIAALQ